MKLNLNNMLQKLKCLIGYHSWSYRLIRVGNMAEFPSEPYPWARCSACGDVYDRKLRSHGTYCYCDCNNELTTTESFVSDTDVVHYACSRCGIHTFWDFDTPVPLRIENYPKVLS
jgi:hypothetical protein